MILVVNCFSSLSLHGYHVQSIKLNTQVTCENNIAVVRSRDVIYSDGVSYSLYSFFKTNAYLEQLLIS